jgi:hypothetical protein
LQGFRGNQQLAGEIFKSSLPDQSFPNRIIELASFLFSGFL